MPRTRAFHPLHVEHNGEFSLSLPLGHVFPLFSPEGERAWVDGWDPEYLHPTHPSNAPGTVFRTRHDDEETLWLVLEYEPRLAEARYGRFTPGSRLGTVLVNCHEDGPARTRVTVRYSLTGLSPAGDAILRDLTVERYAAMLTGWQAAIARSQHVDANQ